MREETLAAAGLVVGGRLSMALGGCARRGGEETFAAGGGLFVVMC